MLASIYRKLNERRIILQRFVLDKNTFPPIKDTNTQLSYCKYVSTVSKCSAGKKSHIILGPSENIQRHYMNLAIEDKQHFVRTGLIVSEISDKEVKELQNLNWASLSPVEFVTHFEKLSRCVNNLDQRPEINYEHFLQAMSALTPHLSDDEIAYVLKYLNLWLEKKEVIGDVMEKILKILDDECLKRAPNMDVESQLFFCNLLCNVRHGRKSLFALKILVKLCNKVTKMTLPQLVHYVFLLGICRNLKVNFYEIEFCLKEQKDNLSLQDWARISIGFFRNEKRFKERSLLSEILESMLKNMETINSSQVSSFSQYLRFGYRPFHGSDDLLRKVLIGLGSRVPDLPLINLTQVSYLAAKVLIFEEELMTQILKRFNEKLHEATLKDIERMTYSMAMFNYESSHPLYRNIVDELWNPNRQQEIENHRKSFVAILKYLALANIYQINLLEKVMESEFMNKAYSNKYAMGDEYYFLDQSIAVEVPNYSGPRLSTNLREFLSWRGKGSMKTVTHTEGLQQIIAICEQLLKPTFPIHIEKILPHFFCEDIVICLDEKNNLINPEPILSAIKPGLVKAVPQEARKYKWLVLILCSRNILMKGTNEPSGILSTKCRQLKSLGYTPIVVSYQTWYEAKNEENCEQIREDYIKTLLNDHLILEQ